MEHLRLIREEAKATRREFNGRFDKVDARFDKIEADIAGLKGAIRGFERNTIAEVYKANLTVASFLDLEQRLAKLERKIS